MITGGGELPNPANTIKFRSMSELDPPIRFLLACGPLGDINVARGCIDEVISMIGGDICKLRMKSVLFTPLEWAAKKGNFDIVEWLCTDDRTKSLLPRGVPGWLGLLYWAGGHCQETCCIWCRPNQDRPSTILQLPSSSHGRGKWPGGGDEVPCG